MRHVDNVRVVWQVRAPGGPTQRPDGAAPERDVQPEAGAVQHRGARGLPGLREGAGHTGTQGKHTAGNTQVIAVWSSSKVIGHSKAGHH